MEEGLDPGSPTGVTVKRPDGAGVVPTMRIHLWLESADGLVFGIGRGQLLAQIERHGSLKQAAAELGMSYRAAWGKIRVTETALGQKIIRRSGHRRDGQELTEFGKQLQQRFNQWFEGVERYALESAGQFFPWPLQRFSACPRPAKNGRLRKPTPAGH